MDRSVRVIIAIAVAAVVSGCSSTQNPSFPLEVGEAKSALREMAKEPKGLVRPLVIVGGYGDPGFATGDLEKVVRSAIDDDRILSVSFTKQKSFDECRADLIAAVDERFGSGDGNRTIEVDVIANSMGGLIAAHAGDPKSGDRSLRMVRMFSLSAPFRGSGTADVFGVNDLVRDMQPDSEFIAKIGEALARVDYEIVPYVRLGDRWVGTAKAAPPGEVAFWVPNRAFQPAHLTAYTDPRMHADILRRLRGEQPYSTEPRAPLPEKYREKE